ncbi:MSHA biogenesis protein MshJ [Glaciimonas sp. GNP009]
MKHNLQPIISKIDAMSLRERIMIFIGAALTLILLFNTLLFNPQFDRQKLMSLHIQNNQSKIAVIQTAIQERLRSRAFDPDVINSDRLKILQEQSQQLHSKLLGLNSVLVKPENMTSLLEDILKRNGALRLISLNTLPVSTLNNPNLTPTDEKISLEKPSVTGAQAVRGIENGSGIYKHGVEIVIQGRYLDMMHYMSALEAMPWQLFWGKATMQIDTYPDATLSLTLFTLSLDEKWLNL